MCMWCGQTLVSIFTILDTQKKIKQNISKVWRIFSPRYNILSYFLKEKKCMTLSHIFLIQNPISENIPLILSEKYFKKTYIMGALKGLWNRRIKGLPIYPLRKIVINNLKVSS